MSMNLHDVTEDDLLSLARQAEESALVSAKQIIALTDPRKVEALYHAWRDVLLDRDKPSRAEAFGAIALLIADFVSADGEECPHCRRVEAARMVALAHGIVEGQVSDSQAVN